MPTYRLYFMNNASGHIEHYSDFEAPDDHAASRLARTHDEPMPLELWTGGRKVIRIEARRASGSATGPARLVRQGVAAL